MSQQSNASFASRAVRYGLVVGAVAAAFNLVLVLSGLYKNPQLGWGVLVVEFLGLVWVLTAKGAPDRRFLYNLGFGALVVLVMAAVIAPMVWVQWTYVAPDYADIPVEQARKIWQERGDDEAAIAEKSEKLRAMYTPIRQAFFSGTGTLMTCLPMVLLIAGALALAGRRGASAS